MRPWPFWLSAIACVLSTPAPARAQSVATLPPTDPIYRDVERLESFGLVPRGLSDQRPLSVGRLNWLFQDARGWMAAHPEDFDPSVRADLDALLIRAERRLNVGAERRASGLMEGEFGGGRSPGTLFPVEDRLGTRVVDAVSNPLWSQLGGRSYGDRVTGALAGRLDVALGTRTALSIGARGALWSASGPVGGRGDAAIEAASLRTTLGPLALDVGRSVAVWGTATTSPLLLSDNGVPLDMVRISTDRPIPLHILGNLDFTLFLADLGPNQNFPHAKEFGIRVGVRPTRGLALGLSALNKQAGEGAPPADLGERIWDATVLGPAIFGDSGQKFSDKLLGVDVRWVFASLQGMEVSAEAILTDFEKNRIADILDVAAGYRAGVLLPRLGTSQRHSIALQGQRTGVFVYRHFQFRSGLAVERLLQGSTLGPDARGVTLRYAYDAPRARARLEVAGILEDRSADVYDERNEPHRDVYKSVDLPDEVRGRLQLSLTHWIGASTLLLRAGVERVRNPLYPEAGPSRTNAAVLVRWSRAF